MDHISEAVYPEVLLVHKNSCSYISIFAISFAERVRNLLVTRKEPVENVSTITLGLVESGTHLSGSRFP